MKKVFLFALIAIVMCACSDNMMLNEPENPVLCRSNDQTPTVSYSVTPDMVCKYLNIARKGKTIDSITPVIEDGDTLAYVAQYTGNNGWDLISGDKRVAPVLASANSGILNLNDTINPAVKALNGMVQIVLDAKESADTIKDKMWEFLEPKTIVINNRPQQRGNGIGKWIIDDTIYESDNYTAPHIITTKWGQGEPWFYKTPYINGTHSKVGCVSVAAGQIIYHFRKNNNRDILLPTKITYNDTINGYPTFTDFSTFGWSSIKTVANYAWNPDNGTAKFLSYLGNQLGTRYGLNESGADPNDVPGVLASYRLSSTKSNMYNFDIILENLKSSKPVYVSCESTNGIGHSFIIDAYEYRVERMYVKFIWDPNAELEDGEDPMPESAITDKDGKYERIEDITCQEYYSIMMNWGYDGSYDNYKYTAYSYTKWGEDSPIIRYYDPYWTINLSTYTNFGFMIYNITEAI